MQSLTAQFIRTELSDQIKVDVDLLFASFASGLSGAIVTVVLRMMFGFIGRRDRSMIGRQNLGNLRHAVAVYEQLKDTPNDLDRFLSTRSCCLFFSGSGSTVEHAWRYPFAGLHAEAKDRLNPSRTYRDHSTRS
ncbi:MAG: hypothetical protein SOY75_04115 [Peptoniphilaceae bacterium]|nr:hypothetical protein [Peptoniphilaceae bacterium]